jgi:hypothetical protein
VPNFQTPLLTAVGRTLVAGRLVGLGSPPSYINWGSSSTPPAVSQTALGAEIGGRVAVTTAALAGPISGIALGAVQYTATLTAGGSANIWEIGLFDAASGGNLITRGLLSSALPVLPGDTLSVILVLEFL